MHTGNARLDIYYNSLPIEAKILYFPFNATFPYQSFYIFLLSTLSDNFILLIINFPQFS